MSFLTSIFGDPNEKVLQEFNGAVEKINQLEERTKALSLEELKAQTTRFRERLQKGEALDDVLPEAFATVREAAHRVLGQRHYDVQLMGGIALHNGSIAEMRTGEGKTLTSTAPLYLNALPGKGVHLVTVNDYLARRDAVWMGKVYHALGLSVGIIQNQGVSYVYDPDFKAIEKTEETPSTIGAYKVEYDTLRPSTRKESYQCDIIYGTNNEFGFDYLRDNMAQRLDDCVQRSHTYAIVDEVDSILIDEARTPLIISAPAQEATDMYYKFADLVLGLKENADYNVDEKMRASTLTEAGIQKMEEALGMGNIYTEGGIRMVHHIEQALKAHTLFARDKEYVVENNEVIIVDEFTGRKMPGRRYSEGLHQALEAKEHLPIQRESQTLATITFQNYFRLYDKLAGMTGTAATEAEEFGKIYGLEVTIIPTNKALVRMDSTDRIYKSEQGKLKAVIERVKDAQKRGQPVLLGTISIEQNEELSALLTQEGVRHEILNAKNHEREGEIIAQAGRPGAVTLATNMAGRGVDIILGGNPPDPQAAVAVKEAGGLFVIGTERHESRRIDNQLRGRSGRQGDPGATQFFVSVEDSLMRIFAGDRMKSLMNTLKFPEDMPIENKLVSRALEQAQKKVEGHNFDIRKHLLEYDDVLNKHREAIYRKRRRVLEIAAGQLPSSEGPTTLRDIVLDMIENEIEAVVSLHTTTVEGGDINLKEIVETMNSMFPLAPETRATLDGFEKSGLLKRDAAQVRTDIIEVLLEESRKHYGALEKSLPDTRMMQALEAGVLLRAFDMLWVEHLVSIDHLRTGIGLRGYGQRDPLVEYKKEAFRLFNQLQDALTKEVAYSFFKAAIATSTLGPSIFERKNVTLSGAAKTMNESAGSGFGGVVSQMANPVVPKERNESGEKVGRNDACPCGSGKKFKRCHGT